MKQYRAIAQQLQREGANPEDVWAKQDNHKWLRAQQTANQRNYLEQMLGHKWMELDTTAFFLF